MTAPGAPAPFTLAPTLLDKVWGGDRLARFNKPVAPGARVGESWELADMASTSASGAGGGAQQALENAGGVGEISKEKIGRVCGEFLDRIVAGGDGDGFCADGAAAFDVARRVADDEDFFGREFDAMALQCSRAGEFS